MARKRSENRYARRHPGKLYHHDNRPRNDQFVQEIPLVIDYLGKTLKNSEVAFEKPCGVFRTKARSLFIIGVKRIIHDRKPAKKVFGL